MALFFANLTLLNQFTQQLPLHKNKLNCKNCRQNHRFMSHGFVYKKNRGGKISIVGKRLFCSNRSQHSGCGSTLRIYLFNQIPRLHYSASVLFRFIKALLANHTIGQAYFKATLTASPRNASRWLKKLYNKLFVYRTLLIQNNHRPITSPIKLQSKHPILMATLTALFKTHSFSNCSEYQINQQTAFI